MWRLIRAALARAGGVHGMGLKEELTMTGHKHFEQEVLWAKTPLIIGMMLRRVKSTNFMFDYTTNNESAMSSIGHEFPSFRSTILGITTRMSSGRSSSVVSVIECKDAFT